jgi:nucleoside 2-deoxyribosyltransferase
MARIYIAGPLFNAPERSELDQIAAVLEGAGHVCFLPHRDGMNIAALAAEMERQGAPVATVRKTVLSAVFDLDMHLLLEQSDIIVASLNGRVPDEGTIAEAAAAWHARIPVVLYKADSRVVMQGGDNPLLVGLTDFTVAPSIASLPQAVTDALATKTDRVARAVARGAAIAAARLATPDPVQFAALLLREFA